MKISLNEYRKAIIALVPLVIAVLALAGVHADATIKVIAGAALAVIPIAVYLVKNHGQVTAPYANKAIVTLGSAVVGVCMAFHLDVSHQVAQISLAATALTPLLVFFIHNVTVAIPPPAPVAVPDPNPTA